MIEKIERDNNLKEKLIFQKDKAERHASRESKAVINIYFRDNFKDGLKIQLI